MIGLEPGYLFGGRYKIIKPIGAGGMGAVYLACDPRYDNFLVALKVLYPGIIKTEESRERFRNEILATYRVNHRNVVRAYEYFDEDAYQAFAMEYVEGGDLLKHMREKPLAYTEIMRVIRQTAAGLGAIHKEGIVHRDLKPENVMLNERGEVKITDFGVASLKGIINLSLGSAMVGTPKYLAPEYVETGECDHRGDIYALGIIAYELTSGHSPFKSQTGVSLIVERLKAEVDPLSVVAPDCPEDFIKIIERMMSVSVARRYQTAEEIILDIERVERGEPLEISWSEEDIESGSFDFVQEAAVVSETPSTSLYDDEILDPRPRRSRTWAIWCAAIALIATGAMYYRLGLFAPGAVGLARLSNGTYRGTVSGLLDSHETSPLTVWRTKAGTFVLLGEPYCRVVPLTATNRFACGDLEFEIRVEKLGSSHSIGAMRELGFGTEGGWQLTRVSND